MRQLLIRSGIVLATALASMFAFTAPAQAWGSKTGCPTWGNVQHSNAWGFFAGHNVTANVKACASASRVFWVGTPNVTFPSRSPFGGLESIDLTVAPYHSNTTFTNGVASKVTFRFQVRQCVAPWFGPACNDFAFNVHVTTMGTQLCAVGGSCDAVKRW